jgi:acetate kinase
MGRAILTLNCGSSSIKFSVFATDQDHHLYHGVVDQVGTAHTHISYTAYDTLHGKAYPHMDMKGALYHILQLIADDKAIAQHLAGIGHRVVHGGSAFTAPTRIYPETLAALQATIPLAPLHNPNNIMGIEIAMAFFPAVPNIAVFDTAFHSTIPEVASRYAIDRQIAAKYHIKRYGFHGLSHEAVYAAIAADYPHKRLQLLSAHLGNGASICAIDNGKSMDISMGFTPLAGVVMGTRSGDIDPGILGHIASQEGWDMKTIQRWLNSESGLLALSGKTNDMRQLEALYQAGDAHAQQAIDIFCYQIAKYLASYLVAIPHCNAIAFTGGIGENSPFIRSRILQHLAFLPIILSQKANVPHQESVYLISQPTSTIACYVVKADEERYLYQKTLQLYQGEVK